jgi:hypothetical protein
MKRLLLALLLTVVLAPVGRADFEIRAPYVYLRVGQPTVIRVPYVNLVLPGPVTCRKAPTVGVAVPVKASEPGNPPPVPVDAAPLRLVPPVQTAAAPPPAAPAPVLSVQEFASSFKALPEGGNYEVMLKHPFTGEPVPVRFTLPKGTPKKVTAGKLRLEFRYGLFKTVVVRFYRDGKVKVLRG